MVELLPRPLLNLPFSAHMPVGAYSDVVAPRTPRFTNNRLSAAKAVSDPFDPHL